MEGKEKEKEKKIVKEKSKLSRKFVEEKHKNNSDVCLTQAFTEVTHSNT